MNHLVYKIKQNKKLNILTFENVRITFISDRIIRFEYSKNKKFKDNFTQMIINRYISNVKYSYELINNILYVHTKYYYIKINILKRFSKSSFEIKYKNNNIYKYGINQDNNLLSTARTLDGIDGETKLDNGLFSLDGYSILHDNSLIYENGFARKNIYQSNIDIYSFYFEDKYLYGLNEFSKISGKTPLIPRYVFGNWWSRYHKYTHDSLLELLNKFYKNDIPLSVCIIDMDWHLTDLENNMSGWTGYTWNKTLFPNPIDTISKIHSLNLKTSLNLHPADGIRSFEDRYDILKSMLLKKYKPNETLELDPFNMDYISKYFKYILNYFEDTYKIDFWWIDWQQGCKTKVSNLDPLFQLNQLHYMDLSRNNNRSLTFSRYPGIGGHRYPIGFSGDSVVSYKSLDFQPYFTSNSSNILYSYWSHDIGGHFNGNESENLYTRWVQLGVFSPIFRLHCTNDINISRSPFDKSDDTYMIVKKFMQLRHMLIPYIYSHSYKTYKNSNPLVKPIYYIDKSINSYKYKNNFIFGDSMIIFPTTSINNVTEGYLPKGIYYNYFTNEKYIGGRIYKFIVDISDYLVFVRDGSIIPHAILDSKNLWQNPNKLLLDIYTSKNMKYVLYEDDSLTNNYLENKNIQTTFEGSLNKNIINFNISYIDSDNLFNCSREYILKFRNINSYKNIESKNCNILNIEIFNNILFVSLKLTNNNANINIEI